MRSILFFICLIFTFGGQAQEEEKSHMWKVELSGALNNNSAWEVEPSVTYLPIPYVGITMGLLFCNTIEKDSYTGFSRDNQWFWDSDESNPGCHFFALRPAIQLVTPAFKFGKDKDTGLSLVVLADYRNIVTHVIKERMSFANQFFAAFFKDSL